MRICSMTYLRYKITVMNALLNVVVDISAVDTRKLVLTSHPALYRSIISLDSIAMNSSVLEPILDRSIARAQTSSNASMSSQAETVNVSNRDISMHTPSTLTRKFKHLSSSTMASMYFATLALTLKHFAQSAADQKAAFYAVWDADSFPRNDMTNILQSLVDVDNRQVENDDVNEHDKAELRSMMEHHLTYNASSERRTIVSQFITVLAGLSAGRMREMLSMARVPTPFMVLQVRGHESPSTLTASRNTIATAPSTDESEVCTSL